MAIAVIVITFLLALLSTHILPQGQHCWKIMKPPQSLPLQMAERLVELN